MQTGGLPGPEPLDENFSICTHNGAKVLQNAIQSLVQQTLSKKDYEILVVDNTREIVKQFETGENLRYIFEPNLGLSNARNTGWQNAGGEFVAYLDDDAIACTEWPIAEYTGQKSEDYFEIAKERWHPEWCQTEMEHINYHFRQDDEHRFAYDFKTLVRALSSAGFQEIQRRDFDPELGSVDRKLGTLYVNASKQNTK